MPEFSTRPISIAGPVGPPTIDDQPSPAAGYRVARRKAALLAAIDGGPIGLEDACTRHRLGSEEPESRRRR